MCIRKVLTAETQKRRVSGKCLLGGQHFPTPSAFSSRAEEHMRCSARRFRHHIFFDSRSPQEEPALSTLPNRYASMRNVSRSVREEQQPEVPHLDRSDCAFTSADENAVNHAAPTSAAVVLIASPNAAPDAQVPCVTMALGSHSGFALLSESRGRGCSVEQCSTR
jgi:hypothetical protein